MTVLGLDPGFSTTGYAVIAGQFPKVISSGRFEFAAGLAREKLPAIIHAVAHLIQSECEEPPVVAIEEAWQGSRSHQVAGKLGELVGALRAVAIAHGLDVVPVGPRQWHSANGLPMRGSRDLIADRAPAMASLRAGYPITSPDESAAVLIAWTAHGMVRMGRAA